MEKINLSQLIKELEDVKRELSSLKSLMASHIHDGFTSQRLNNKNIIYDIIRPTFYKQELADDAYIIFPENNGMFLLSVGDAENDIDNIVYVGVSSNGDVYMPSASATFDNTDSDGYLCVFNTGTEVRIKNRLGSKKIIKIANFS